MCREGLGVDPKYADLFGSYSKRDFLSVKPFNMENSSIKKKIKMMCNFFLGGGFKSPFLLLRK